MIFRTKIETINNELPETCTRNISDPYPCKLSSSIDEFHCKTTVATMIPKTDVNQLEIGLSFKEEHPQFPIKRLKSSLTTILHYRDAEFVATRRELRKSTLNIGKLENWLLKNTTWKMRPPERKKLDVHHEIDVISLFILVYMFLISFLSYAVNKVKM